ncbi:hypothetical protein J2Z32_003769 [Paenibacillus turicensis]|uniref:Uncharacterized protein n=1 Tax=Paenibacillus turicensis TaxID=160487 RepID=A0ABS4FX62_9BACL|nr:hypothetical protein [Paenibacillus turicensis]MBP1907104.1 hypothetical protein [Paenibacillus turicensis]
MNEQMFVAKSIEDLINMSVKEVEELVNNDCYTGQNLIDLHAEVRRLHAILNIPVNSVASKENILKGIEERVQMLRELD